MNTKSSGQRQSGAEIRQKIRESIRALEPFGIAMPADEAIEKMAREWEEAPIPFPTGKDLVRQVLFGIGMGDYDYDTDTWTPFSNAVYALDVEVFNIEQMYTLFMQGINAITPEEDRITAAVEDMSGVDMEEGTGERVVTFVFRGEKHAYTAEENFDWLDAGIFDFLNDMYEKAGETRRLYVAVEDQSCIAIFSTKEKARALSKAVGLPFSDRLAS